MTFISYTSLNVQSRFASYTRHSVYDWEIWKWYWYFDTV